MNGILNVMKPPGMTSFDVVGFLRGLLKIKKIGHTGTLDPGAVGVLPICIGSATRAVEFMTEKDKIYRAELTLGTETDTQDSFGSILNKKDVNCTIQEVQDAVYSFRGEYKQLPPMFSAIKIGGEKLYDLARKGITVEREHRDVKIHSIEIISIDLPKILFDVSCSKGTYIRTLCHDIGQKLGVGGHMSFLMRLEAGAFKIKDALTVEEIIELHKENRLTEKIKDIDIAFMQFDSLKLDDNMIKKLFNGGFVEIDLCGTQFVRVYNMKNEFVALGEVVNGLGSIASSEMQRNNKPVKTLLKTKKQF